MDTYADWLGRFEVVSRIPLVRETIGDPILDWACGHLRDHAHVRDYVRGMHYSKDSLPPALLRKLRAQRIIAAANLIGDERPGVVAKELHIQTCAVQRVWPAHAHFDLGADSIRGNLHAGNSWGGLPSQRTYWRLMTKQG